MHFARTVNSRGMSRKLEELSGKIKTIFMDYPTWQTSEKDLLEIVAK